MPKRYSQVKCIVLAFVDYLVSLIRDLLANLYADISSIPLSISIRTALLLTMMYIAGLISSMLIKILLVSMWILALAAYFFPTLIPEGYGALFLILLTFIIGITAALMKIRSKRLRESSIDNALSEMLKWMRESDIINSKVRLDDQYIKYRLKEILKKQKLC
ncbi:MAG: hypothetical protein QW238_04820 [Candidatus Bathyarchaeia archaeon]